MKRVKVSSWEVEVTVHEERWEEFTVAVLELLSKFDDHKVALKKPLSFRILGSAFRCHGTLELRARRLEATDPQDEEEEKG